MSVPEGALVASWRRETDPVDSGPISFGWIGDAELFVASAGGDLRAGGQGGEKDMSVVRLGTVQVGAEKDVDSPRWKGRTFLAATVPVPWISVARGLTVVPLYEMHLPGGADDIERSPLQLWVGSDKLGFVERGAGDGDEGEDRAEIVVLDLGTGKRFNLTRSLAARLRRLRTSEDEVF